MPHPPSIAFSSRLGAGSHKGTFPPPAGSPCMPQDRYDWPRVGGSVVVWLLIAAVAGMGLFAVADPGSIEVLVTAEL